MVWDGTLLQSLLVQTPVVAILLIILFLDRREHAKAIEAMRDEIKGLQQAIIDHLNRLSE